MGFCHRRLIFVVRAIPLLLIPFLFNLVGAQGLQTSPYSAADEVRRGFSPGRLDLAPSNPLGPAGSSFLGPRGSDTIPISSGMFSGIMPRIPNLELGFLYNFGNNVSSGRFTADYVLPFSLSCDSVIFGEAHTEWQDFWKTPTVSVTSAPGFTVTTSGTSNRVDLSFGGGYRTMLGESTLLGVNGFYDASRLSNKWYSSGGIGLEMAANVSGDDAIDLNFNWYGNLFTRDGIINAFRNKAGSYDVEAGYSHALFNRSLDLRLKATGYQFDIGSAVYGWRGGADLTTRDGMFTVRYEHGHDRINGDYNTIGGFVNVGFQLENVLKGESPFTAPEPVFKSPRDLRRLLELKVKRDWHQPAAVVLANQIQNQGVAAERKLELVAMYTVSLTGTFTPDLANNSWSLTSGDCTSVDVCYQVKVSDGSLTELQGFVTPPEFGGVFLNHWSATGSQLAGPTPMTTSPQDLCSLVGFGTHFVQMFAAGSVSGTVTIYSTDSSIAPLTINFTISASAPC